MTANITYASKFDADNLRQLGLTLQQAVDIVKSDNPVALLMPGVIRFAGKFANEADADREVARLRLLNNLTN